jgi:hypothetical protein
MISSVMILDQWVYPEETTKFEQQAQMTAITVAAQITRPHIE